MNNNPLRQYFRRPAVYLRLPSGGKDYAEGIIDLPENGEIPVYPMTAIDEITTRTPDALFNGTALAELIKSCIPNIKDPWAVSSNDMDAILISIKAASGGDTLDIDTVCPACEESNIYGINLLSMLASLKPSDYEKELESGELFIKFKPLKYKDMNDAAIGQFELQRTLVTLDNIESEEERNAAGKQALENITNLTMEILSKTIDYIKTPTIIVREQEYILDFLRNCDKNIFTAIKDFNTELKAASEIKPIHITCASCGHEYDQQFTLSPVDFFE
jgi:hypothetical protein